MGSYGPRTESKGRVDDTGLWRKDRRLSTSVNGSTALNSISAYGGVLGRYPTRCTNKSSRQYDPLARDLGVLKICICT